MDLLTTSVNVPAEREKLRQLRNEIAADVAHREDLARRYGVRGYGNAKPAENHCVDRFGKKVKQ